MSLPSNINCYECIKFFGEYAGQFGRGCCGSIHKTCDKKIKRNDKCYDCKNYKYNNDDISTCNGEEKACHEFISIKAD